MAILEIVVGAFGILFAVWLLLGFIDWLDRLTSRITPEQARRQTRQWLQRSRPPE